MTPQSTATVKANAPPSRPQSRQPVRARGEAEAQRAERLLREGPRATQPKSDDKYFDVPCTD